MFWLKYAGNVVKISEEEGMVCIMRDWLLHLRQENQEWVEYEQHLYYPLYLSTYVGAIRNIFFRVLRERETHSISEGKFTYIGQRDNSNIISFVGSRGSGKTTAMREFCQILRGMNRQDELMWWVEQAMPETELREKIVGQQFYFHVLRSIDASRLEEKEDLFDVIMANIYREFRRVQRECNGSRFFSENGSDEERIIINKFEQILTNYHAVKNAKKEDFGDSSIAKMEYMSGSMDIRAEMDELVEKLLARWNTLERRNDYGDSRLSKGTENFLVIAIDDLDLNIIGGYDMLNQLYKYFSNQNIILAIAVDYDQINRICEMHYLKEFVQDMNITDGSGDVVARLAEQCKKLSRDYITKMLPVDNRFFMPSLSGTSRQLAIGADKEACASKYFILKKIARHMKIYYDSNGIKSHFSEQESVRETVMYNQFLDGLYEIDFECLEKQKTSRDEKRKILWYYDQNHEKFNADITGRMVQRCLNETYRKIFEELYKKELARRAFYFCAMAKPRISNKENNLEMSSDYREHEYTYSTLLECIYKLGRVSAQDKEFIKCVLASFTSEMVREYVCHSYYEEGESRKKAVNRLNKFLGRTFGGEWLSHVVPMLDGEVEVAYRDGLDMHWVKLEFEFPSELFLIDDYTNRMPITSVKRAETLIAGLKKWLETEKIIPTLECIFTFFVEQKGESSIQERRGFEVRIDKEPGQGEQRYLTVGGREMSVCLDIFSFVKETFYNKKDYTSMQEALVKAFCDEICRQIFCEKKESEGERAHIVKAVRGMVEQLSIYKKLNWRYKAETAFPFYDLDLSYNIMKRVYKKFDFSSEKMDKGSCYSYICKVYEEIGQNLKEQKNAYQGTEYNYDDIFNTCPFIKAFLNYNKYLHKDFPNLFGMCIANSQRLVRFDVELDMPD